VALREGVERVANALLVDSAQAQAVLAEKPNAVRAALGKDMVAYTSRYRIVEDRGERTALFTENPDFDTEYQVVVEVYVDVDRVEAQLVSAGLLAPAQPAKNLSGVRIEVRGLTEYAGYEAFRALLLDDLGASEVSVVEFARGRIRMIVATESNQSDLVTDMQAAAPASLEIVPLEVDDVLVLAVRWDSSAAPEADEVPVWRESGSKGPGSDGRAGGGQ